MKRLSLLLFAIAALAASPAALADSSITVDGTMSSGEWPSSGFTFDDADDMGWLFGHRDIQTIWATDDNSSGSDGFFYVAIEFQSDFRETVLGVDIDVMICIDVNMDGDTDDPEDRTFEVTDGVFLDGNGDPVSDTGLEWAYDGPIMEIGIPYDMIGVANGSDTFGLAAQTAGLEGYDEFSPEPDGGDGGFIVYDGTQDPEPLSVRLLAAWAEAGRGGVDVRWVTVSERQNAGFHVLRRRGGGPWTSLTDELVPGLGDAPFGRSYHLRDPEGRRGDEYRVVDVEIGGARHWHPPVIAGLRRGHDLVGGAAAPRSEPVAVDLSPEPIAPEDGPADAVKLAVGSGGLHRVLFSDLEAAGLDGAALVAEGVSFTRGGRPVPVGVDAEGAWLWADPARDRWADFDVLVARPGQGRSVRSLRVQGACGDPVPALRQELEIEEQLLYYVSAPSGDPIYWDMALSGTPASLSFDAPGTAPGGAEIEIRLAAAQFLDAPEHSARFTLNGEDLGVWEWQGFGLAEATVQIPDGLLLESGNALEVALADEEAIDLLVVSDLVLRHAVAPRVGPDGLVFEAEAGDCVRVGGLEAGDEIAVLDVTNPSTPRALWGWSTLADGEGGAAIRFRVRRPGPRMSGERVLAVARLADAATPDPMGPLTGEDLVSTSMAADYLIVSHPSLVQAAEQLAAHHESRGLATAVVTTEQAYDAFGDGRPGPWAIRELLDTARSDWAVAPAFVLLLGGSTVDSNGYLGDPRRDLVPAPFRTIAAHGYEAVSDVWYVAGDDGVEPWAAVGRLAAQSPAEAEAVVRKTIDWQASAPIPAGRALFVADRDQADPEGEGEFAAAVDEVIATCANGAVDPERLLVADSPDPVGDLLAAAHDGVDALSFAGHAFVEGWSSPAILSTSSVDELENEHLFVALSWSCLDGSFVGPWGDSLSWALVSHPSGGASAAVASSTLIEPEAAAEVALDLTCRLASGEAATLGEALAETRRALRGFDPFLDDALATFNLLGDPATPNPWAAP